jgi:DNA-binding transcriptional LysR family regulator
MANPTSLPPLDYFLAFEAAAKAGSFSGASQVLHISESAISRKIRLLEEHYQLPLFVRGHRSVALTAQGQDLLGSVSRSIDILRDASRSMHAQSGSRTVNLAATNSVAALWLMPRLRKFNQVNSHIRIMLVSSDDDDECLSDKMDLAILRGDGEWPGFEARKLFGETVFPVCSPRYLKEHPAAKGVESLPGLDLIEVSSSHYEWMDWKTWMYSQSGSEPVLGQTTYFNTYPLAIQAAVDGLGIALGWGHLVDHLLEAGELVRVADENFARTNSGYFLLKRNRKKSFPEMRIVENWLMAASARRKRYAPERA